MRCFFPSSNNTLQQINRRLIRRGKCLTFPANRFFKNSNWPPYKGILQRLVLPRQNFLMFIGRVKYVPNHFRHSNQAVRQAVRMADHAVINFVFLPNANAAERSGIGKSLPTAANSARGEIVFALRNRLKVATWVPPKWRIIHAIGTPKEFSTESNRVAKYLFKPSGGSIGRVAPLVVEIS